MTRPIRVLLVDDDALVRSGLKMMLAGAGQVAVVGEARDGRGVLAAVDLHHPDVVLMDIRMPASTASRPPGCCAVSPVRGGDRAHHLRCR